MNLIIRIKNQKKRRGKNIYIYIKARLKKRKTRRALKKREKKKNVNALAHGSKHGALGTDRLIIYSKMYESKSMTIDSPVIWRTIKFKINYTRIC